MTMTENANLIESLRAIGFTDSQITDFLLSVAGRISIEDFKKKFEKNGSQK